MKSWKEAKFGKPHRNIKTDITAVRRLSAPTVKDWAWTKRPHFRAAEAYGLGIAGMFQTCGSVCGMMMLAGLKNSECKHGKPSFQICNL